MFNREFGSVAAFAFGLIGISTCCAAPPRGAASRFLEPKPLPGQTLSIITYRVISIYGPDIDDSVVSIPATATYTFEPSASADIIRWKADVRMDGKRVLKDYDGEYRDQGNSLCHSGKCSFNSNASGPFYNPTFWGAPKGKLKGGSDVERHAVEAMGAGTSGFPDHYGSFGQSGKWDCGP